MSNDVSTLYLLIRINFLLFLEKVFETLHPGDLLISNWHLEVFEAWVEHIMKGTKRNVVIAAPPRSLKSLTFNVALSAWILGQDPKARIIGVSHNMDLAVKHSIDVRKVLLSSWYKKSFPKTRLSQTKSTEDYFETTKNGSRRAISAEGGVTGQGADFIIADDLVDANDANNIPLHEKRAHFLFNTLWHRLNNPNVGRLIIVGQRLHLLDPMSVAISTPGFELLKIPIIAPCDETYELKDGKTHTRKTGDVLCSSLMDEVEIAKRRKVMTVSAFEALFMQDPIPEGGGLFDFAKLPRFSTPPKNMLVFHSWDMAYSKGKNDRTACATIGVCDEQYFLLNLYAAQLDFDGVLALMKHKIQTENPAFSIVEASGGIGEVAIQRFRAKGYDRFLPYTPHMPKKERFYKVSPIFQAGDFFIPTHAPWLKDFRNEYMAFPAGEHDDMLDTISQFLLNAFFIVRKVSNNPPVRYFSGYMNVRITKF